MAIYDAAVVSDLLLGYAEVATGTNAQIDGILGYVEYTGNALPEPALFIENWDLVSAPTLPSTWATTQVVNNGTAGAWITSTTQRYSGSNSASFNSDVATAGNQTRLYHSAAYDFTQGPTLPKITFWMYHDTGNSTLADCIQIQISTDGTTWSNVGVAVNRYSASAGWVQHAVDLSAYAANTTVYLGLLATSQVGGAMYVDDIALADQPAATNQMDLVLGYVEILGSEIEIDLVQAYVEVLFGNDSTIRYGPRWQ